MSALPKNLEDEFEIPPGAEVSAGTRQFITFTCAGQSFGVDIMSMREIRNWSPVTPLPAQKPDVLGIIEIRGRVIPIHDLAMRIGCRTERQAGHEGQVILVLSIRGHDMGLLVDTVSDIIEIKSENVLAVPQIEGSAARFLAGIARQGDTLVAILDEETVLREAVEIAGAETVLSHEPTNDESGSDVDEAEFVFVDEIQV
jgi:purine-binding chemotaxis protein CheW